MNGVGNVSGSITFSNQDLCPTCKLDWQHKAAFSGIFSGHPVSGKYTWEDAPGPQGFTDFSSLSLMYNYHHINLLVMGNLTVINPAHMEWSHIGPINYDRHDYVVDGDYRLATGLHLHLGDVIHLMRGGTTLNIPSSQLEHQAHTAYDDGPSIAHATNESPYMSGYKHGVSDGMSYLTTPGKGFAFHTTQFNQGFIDGFCSIEGKGAGSDADEGTFECSLDATQFKGK